MSIERCHLDVAEVALAENRVADPRKRRPAITFHGKEAALNEAENERRISMDVDGARSPGMEGHDNGCNFSNVIVKRKALGGSVVVDA